MSADRWVLVPRDLLERASTSLAAFVSDEGWAPADIDNMDAIDAALAAAPAAPAAEPVCRSDGRCQYAIDSGAEGLGHCPKGKCIMPAAPAQSREPLTDEQIDAAVNAWFGTYPIEVTVTDAFRARMAAALAAAGIGSQP